MTSLRGDFDAATTALSNDLILGRILSLVKGGRGRRTWGNLRLVSRAFNQAVLSLPHPTPLSLQVHALPRSSPYRLTPKICQSVDMKFSRFEKGREENLKGFLKFSQSIGHKNIQVVTLTCVHPADLKALLCALNGSCQNLASLRLSLIRFHVGTSCTCVQQENLRQDAFRFKRFFANLLTLWFIDSRCRDYVTWRGGTCPLLEDLVRASPNLRSLRLAWTDLFFDLSSHKALSQFTYKGFHIHQLLRTVTVASAAHTLERLDLTCFEGLGLLDAELRLPPLPRLVHFHASLPSIGALVFFVAPCVFAEGTRSLTSLSIDCRQHPGDRTARTLLQTLLSSERNERLTKLSIRLDYEGQYFDRAGVLDADLLTFLHSAFPNLRALSLLDVRGTGKGGSSELKDILDFAGKWSHLTEVKIGVNFHLPLDALIEGLEGLSCRHHIIQVLEIGRIHSSSHYQEPLPPSDVFQKMLLELMDSGNMEKVVFRNFQMPHDLDVNLRRFIASQNLPLTWSRQTEENDDDDIDEDEELPKPFPQLCAELAFVFYFLAFIAS